MDDFLLDYDYLVAFLVLLTFCEEVFLGDLVCFEIALRLTFDTLPLDVDRFFGDDYFFDWICFFAILLCLSRLGNELLLLRLQIFILIIDDSKSY